MAENHSFKSAWKDYSSVIFVLIFAKLSLVQKKNVTIVLLLHLECMIPAKSFFTQNVLCVGVRNIVALQFTVRAIRPISQSLKLD